MGGVDSERQLGRGSYLERSSDKYLPIFHCHLQTPNRSNKVSSFLLTSSSEWHYPHDNPLRKIRLSEHNLDFNLFFAVPKPLPY